MFDRALPSINAVVAFAEDVCLKREEELERLLIFLAIGVKACVERPMNVLAEKDFQTFVPRLDTWTQVWVEILICRRLWAASDCNQDLSHTLMVPRAIWQSATVKSVDILTISMSYG